MRIGNVLLGTVVLLFWMGNGLRAAVTIDEGPNNNIATTVARHASNEPMVQMAVDNAAGQPNAEVTSVTITAAGTGDDLADLPAGGVQLYWDKNNDGKLTTTGGTVDTLLGSGSFSANNGTCTISGFVVPVPNGTGVNLLGLYTFGAGATAGETFRARILTNGSVSVRDASTLTPLGVTGAPADGFLRTIGSGRVTVTRVTQNPDGATAIPNRSLLPLVRLTLAADNVEDIQVNSIDFLETGTANGITGILAGSVRLFQMNTAPSDSGTAVATGSFPSDGGRISLAPTTPLVIPRNGSKDVWLTVDIVALAQGVLGAKYKVQFPGATPMSASGVTSTDACPIVGAPINGPEWEFNYNPVTFALQNDLGAALMPRASQNYPVCSFQVNNDNEAKSEACAITQFKFTASGTMNDLTAISQVELYTDNNPFGKITGTDVLLGTGVFTGDNGTVTINFAGTPVTLAVNGSEKFIVGYDLNGTAVDGQTARVSVASRNDMMVVGAISAVNSSMSPSPFQGALRTVGLPRAQLTCGGTELISPSTVPPSAPDFAVFPFKLKALGDEDLVFKGLRFDLTGPGNEIPYFTRFRLFTDLNANGEVDGDDGQLGLDVDPAPVGGDSQITFNLEAEVWETISRNQTKSYTLYCDVSSGVIGDGSEGFTIGIGDDEDIFLFGSTSDGPANFTAAPPPCSDDKVIRNPAITITKYPTATPSEITGCINGAYGMIGSSFFVPSGEDILINSVRFSVTGSLQDNLYVDEAYAWKDDNKNFYINTGEDYLGEITMPKPIIVDNGSAIVPLAATADRNKTYNLSVGLDFDAILKADAVAQIGKDITAHQVGNLVVTGVGAISGRPVEVTNAAGDDQGRTMIFDKGSLTIKQDTIPVTITPPNATGVEAFALNFKTGIIEDVRIDRLVLTPTGTINEALHFRQNDSIKIYIDRNRDGVKNSGDYLIGMKDRPTGDNSPLTFTGPDYNFYGPYVYTYPVFGGPYDQYLITVDLLPSAPEGSTIQFTLQSANDVTAIGACSLFDYQNGVEVTYNGGDPPLVGPAITVERGAIDLRTTPAFANDTDNIPNVVMAPNAQNYEVLRMNAKSTSVEPVQLTGLTFHSTGTAFENIDLGPVALYHGATNPGNLLTTGSFTADNGTVTLANFTKDVILHSTGTVELRVAFNGTGSGVMGTHFNLTLGVADIQAVGYTSGLPISSLIPTDPYLGIPILFDKGRLTVRVEGEHDEILPIPLGGDDTSVQKIKFTASRTEGFDIEGLQVRAAGTANEVNALENGAVKMIQNTGGGQTIASAPFLPADNGLATLTNLNIQLDADDNTGTKYELDGLLNPAGTVVGTSLQFDIESLASLTVTGQLTGQVPYIVLQDFAGNDQNPLATTLTGRTLTFSTGKVTLSNGAQNPGNQVITGAEALLPALQIKSVVAPDLEGVTLTSISICASGTVDETTAIGNVYLYNDVNGNGQVSGTDVLLATTTFNANDGQAVFSGLNLTYPAGSTTTWLIVVQLTNVGLEGQTVRLGVCTPPTVLGLGQLTDEAINLVIANPSPLGGVLTILHPTPTPTPTPSVTPSPTATPLVGIVINEIHADPHASQGDANSDGNIGPGDEFVELVNSSAVLIDLGGYKIRDAGANRHVFPPGTLLPPGCAIVVFGAGNPTGSFGGSVVQKASTGGLNLDNAAASGDTVNFTDSANVVLGSYAYGSEGNADVSLTRSPDITGGNPLVQHTAAAGAGGRRFSPGTKVDGTAFSGGVCIITPSPSPTPSQTPSPSPTPFNGALLLSHNIPVQIPQGYGVPVQIRMRNTGDTTWTNAGGYALAVTTDVCGLAPATRIGVPPGVTLGPGSEYNFAVTLTGSPGTCNIQFRMIQEFVEFFGDTLSLTSSIVAPTNNSTTQGENMPAALGPGQPVTGGFLFTNTGNTTWTPENGFSLLVENDLCGLYPAGSIPIPGGDPVPPGQQVFFAAGVTAPQDAGVCAVTLQLQRTGIGTFGASLQAEFEVQTELNDVGDWTRYE